MVMSHVYLSIKIIHSAGIKTGMQSMHLSEFEPTELKHCHTTRITK